MKNPSQYAGTSVGLVEWLKHPGSAFSLVIGANCGCDISRLGREICDHLNEVDPPAGGRYRAFGPGGIRQLAGDPNSRHAILAAAARKGIDLESGCDYECMVRAITALGGAVLCGEWALEASADMDNVFRVVLSRCDQCCPASSLKLDPEEFSAGGLAKIIANRFVHWSEDQAKGLKNRMPRSPALPVLI